MGSPHTRHKGPGRDRSSAKAIATAERHGEWVEQRKRGWSYRKIAARYRVHPSSVEEAVSKCLLAIRVEPARELQALELEALDDLIDQTLEDLLQAEDVATRLACREAIRKVRADRRKMLGLDAPTKVEARLEYESVDIEQLRALLRPLGYDIVPLAIETTGEAG